MTTKKPHRKKKILKLPDYPGGKEEFVKFLNENIKYPAEALKNKIEGDVHLSFEVNNMGEVIGAKILHGIGYGCDEEALRLVSMLKYRKAKNKGVRVTTTKKLRIGFHLPKEKQQGINIKYTLDKNTQETTNKNKSGNYNYTITY